MFSSRVRPDRISSPITISAAVTVGGAGSWSAMALHSQSSGSDCSASPGLAYLAFFRILAAWGATRTSMVAYLLPVFGIVLGAISRRASRSQPACSWGPSSLIAGIALVNSRYGARPLFAQRTDAAAAPR